jgi:hypothetical protein
MNEIVWRHYPVSKLPKELRADLPLDGTVEVQIRSESPVKKIKMVDLIGSAPNVHGSEAEVLAHIREGRDDDR